MPGAHVLALGEERAVVEADPALLGLFAVGSTATDNAAEHRMRWHTRLIRWRQHYLKPRGPRPLIVSYLPHHRMSHLLWYSRHTRTWILELRVGNQLEVIATRRDLGRCDVHPAQIWAYDRSREQLAETIPVWLPVTVTMRRGWTPIHDPDWQCNPLLHDLHPTGRGQNCRTGDKP